MLLDGLPRAGVARVDRLLTDPRRAPPARPGSPPWRIACLSIFRGHVGASPAPSVGAQRKPELFQWPASPFGGDAQRPNSTRYSEWVGEKSLWISFWALCRVDARRSQTCHCQRQARPRHPYMVHRVSLHEAARWRGLRICLTAPRPSRGPLPSVEKLLEALERRRAGQGAGGSRPGRASR
jgi:hypothetical protein